MTHILTLIERETGQTVTEETPLDDLAIDSLEFLQLLLTISEETGLTSPETKMASLNTVGDLLRSLE